MVDGMKRITQTMDYEGPNSSQIRTDLQAWHHQHPFANGIDWESQYMWATMTDEDAFAFTLKHPQYADRFTNG
jgi:hypothetical protein